MLSISNLCRRFGSQVVFDHASWTVTERERVALVGANGSGKSTLLRMIAGLDEPDDGTISLPRGWAVGYLPQDGISATGRTVMEEALGAFADVLALERECRDLEEALAHAPSSGTEHDELLARYTDARARWDVHGSYDCESQAERVLLGLGFTTADFTRDAGEFSGGWQMRLALATLLLRRPNVLLLDEPTNHLDLEARNWLEEFLVGYPHTVILVAHDRYFLDVTMTRISEVSGGRLTDYPAPYSRYLETREAQRAQQLAAYQTQREEIERLEAFISRFRYQASKATLVQSRIKYLEKLERVPPPEGGSASIHFRFPACERSGREVLRLERAGKRYGDLTVYDNLSMTIERGRKVALVGPNGAGKSTLIKMLAGVEPLSAGSRHVGHNVRVGYFAQDQTRVLDPDRTVLDEPTNHLDMTAKQVLLEALQQYTGTLVLVAHDRYVLDQLPEEIIEVGAGHATRYLGNYEDYVRRKAAESDGSLPPPVAVHDDSLPAADDAPAAPATAPALSGGERHAAAKAAARSAARRERDQARLEREITDKEDALAAVSAVINAPDFYQTHESPQQLFSRYAELKRDIDALYAKLDRLERD